MSIDRRPHAVLGALVADAASLGLHWLYDPERIKEVSDDHGGAAFVPIDAAHFVDVPGYFAHGARKDGQSSQYGESLRLALGAIESQGFDPLAYQEAFAAHFGPGGTYSGYIDRPTRGTLENIANDVTDPSGIDDDQLPAVARVPVVVGYGAPTDVLPAIQVTNVNDVATNYGTVFAGLLRNILDGMALTEALTLAAQDHPDLVAALETDEDDSVAYGAVTKIACHLPMAMPLAFHILARADSYSDAIERNIRAGGDSCGRSIVIGAVMGAAHGLEGKGIPLDWILRTESAAEVWAQCMALSK